MTPLFKKLILGARTVIHVLNAPPTFESELGLLEGVEVRRSIPQRRCDFALAFVVTAAERDAASAQLARACEGDAVLWMVYPKGSSRNYRCEFNRDTPWTVLGDAGFEPVRMVAVDADWSALRFRRVEHIRAMTRDAAGAISAAGRARTR